MKVLLIEDDGQFRRVLSLTLTRNGYTVVESSTGEAATKLLHSQTFQIAIVDLGLPDIEGVDLIRILRKESSLPVIVLSARRDEADKVAALDAGADDYLAKPFGIHELLARIRAATRRVTPDQQGLILDSDGLYLNTRNRTASLLGKVIRLTPIEWRILDVLISSSGRVVTNNELIRSVWGDDEIHHLGALRVHISALRQKIEAEPQEPVHLISHPGLGYRIQ